MRHIHNHTPFGKVEMFAGKAVLSLDLDTKAIPPRVTAFTPEGERVAAMPDLPELLETLEDIEARPYAFPEVIAKWFGGDSEIDRAMQWARDAFKAMVDHAVFHLHMQRVDVRKLDLPSLAVILLADGYCPDPDDGRVLTANVEDRTALAMQVCLERLIPEGQLVDISSRETVVFEQEIFHPRKALEFKVTMVFPEDQGDMLNAIHNSITDLFAGMAEFDIEPGFNTHSSENEDTEQA